MNRKPNITFDEKMALNEWLKSQDVDWLLSLHPHDLQKMVRAGSGVDASLPTVKNYCRRLKKPDRKRKLKKQQDHAKSMKVGRLLAKLWEMDEKIDKLTKLVETFIKR